LTKFGEQQVDYVTTKTTVGKFCKRSATYLRRYKIYNDAAASAFFLSLYVKRLRCTEDARPNST